MADTGSSDDPTNETSAVQEFPHKLRVHALARILDIPSREVLAHLAELGMAVRSPQSSIDRSTAIQVRDRLEARSQDAEAGVPGTVSGSADDGAAHAQVSPPAGDAPGVTDAPDDPADPTPSLFSAVDAVEPTSAADITASPQGPLFLQPQAPEAPARRRSPRAVSASVEPDTTSADSGPDTTDTVDAEPTASAAVETSTDRSDGSGEDTTPDGDGSGSGSRRRRRGRRGRGRGRGDQVGEQNSDTDDSSDDAPAAGGSGSDDAGTEDTAENADASDGDTSGEATDGSDRDTDAPDRDAEAPDEASDSSETDTETDSDTDDDSGSNNRRRRRRRRRKGGSDGDDQTVDDPPNTVVHEREPRNKSRASSSNRDRDEVQGISGSTRLEAKRQRRRDGRDAGRRRPPILTESEFLARREAVDRVMVVRERSSNARLSDDADAAAAPTEDYTQVAVLEDGVLVEHFVTTSTSSSMVGNIFLGRVQNVLPGMEAAFVDIGRGRNGVLYAGEVNWDAAGLDGGSRKIEQALRPGDPVVVQVSKDPVGHKGARLTTQISLAGRYLVYVPGGSSTGISRKLPDTERKRLKSILSKLVPSEAGVIIRTASEGVSAEELSADIDRLKGQWAQIEEATAGAGKGKNSAPQALYEEPDLLVKVVRDLFNEDFTTLVVDGDSAWDHVKGYVEAVAPDLGDRLEKFVRPHADSPDAFVVHRIDEQLAKALDRKVWLPSGGTLIIEHTEAMTVVDVNTGKFTGSGGNLEETVTRNNLEAAEEIVRQMRLRDIGGMIIVDFIDMVLESNRDLVLRRLTEALSRDRTRHQVSEVTSLGLVQMTRKRLGTGLLEAFSSTCTCCAGRGIVVHANPVEIHPADDAPRQEGSKRSRKGNGRKKADGPAEAKPANNPSEHPMFRAMASQPEGDLPVHDAQVDLAAPLDGDRSTPDPDTDPIDAATAAVAAVTESSTSTAHVENPVTSGDTIDPAATEGTDPPATSEPVVDTPEADRSDRDVEQPRRRRRAARRPAAAPIATAEPVTGTADTFAAVSTVSDQSGAVTSVATQTADEPVVAVRRRPRRRAAGRPAGPPPED